MLSVLYYCLGAILLVAGRKLYWFFIAVAGMIAGLLLSNILFDAENLTWKIIFAIVGAALGAILAVALQKITIGVVGFIAGGLGATLLWRILELPQEGKMLLIPFILGGIVAALLVILAYEYGLIILTSWGGAWLISQELEKTELTGTGWINLVLFFGLFIIGLVIQVIVFSSEQKKEHVNKERSD